MSTRGSWITLKFKSVLDVVHASRFQSSYGGFKRNSPIMSTTRVESCYWLHPSMQFFSTNSNTKINANGAKKVKVQPEAPASTIFTFPHWLRWVLGSVLSLVLPFWKYVEKLQRIEGEAEVVVEEVEKVAEVVQKVATVAEKVSEDVAEMLPQDGNLQKAALMVEHASKQVAHDAQLAEEFIHKVENVKNDLDNLESFVEPVIDEIVKKEPENN
ncbi:uncharacterized protein LOC133300054 [Gastrolobium bilobum]|uniref:uncharacterized protein LOC133300054 n=1 Tax=Gastrolobium bilobum TaxID=150636 RepID=UPI002AB156F8|nr:uncharacterized protein LOC133300054 [Gastrolobium bilobum]